LYNLFINLNKCSLIIFDKEFNEILFDININNRHLNIRDINSFTILFINNYKPNFEIKDIENFSSSSSISSSDNSISSNGEVVEEISKIIYPLDMKKPKDKFLSDKIKYKDKFTKFNYENRAIIKQKYNKIKGIYLWINNINSRSYVGKSVNLYQRVSKYFSSEYLNKTKSKMAICSAIDKYGIENFSLYILEILDIEGKDLSSKNLLDNTLKYRLRDRENYWYELINPSYNLQSIFLPFTGSNHYRFGKTVSEEIKKKISKTLKGRIKNLEEKESHIKGARKISVYCYDFETKKFLMEFDGLRIAARALNLKDSFYIRYRLDKDKPLKVKIGNNCYNMLFRSKKI
jgi:GIY-YIG catalytic domain